MEKINNKISVLVLSLIILAFISIVFLFNRHTENSTIDNVKQSIEKSFGILKLRIYKRYEFFIESKSAKIVTDSELKNHINFLNERKTASKVTKAQIKINNLVTDFVINEPYNRVSVYDKNGDLSTISLTKRNKTDLIYKNYETGKFVYENSSGEFDTKTDKIATKLELDNLENFNVKYSYDGQNLCMEKITPIKNGSVIGYIALKTCQSKKQLEKLISFTGNEIFFIGKNDKKAIQELNLNKNDLNDTIPLKQYKEHKASQRDPLITDNYILLFHSIPLKNDETLVIAIGSLKDMIDKEIEYTFKTTFMVLFIIFILIYFSILFFTKKQIVEPLGRIMDGISNLKKGEYIPIKLEARNEFSKIAHEFNSLVQAQESSHKKLQKNLAFLKSHQIAMDESSIVTKSDLKGNITYANENFYKITGFTEEETIGKPHNIVRHQDNPKTLFKEIWETIKAKKVWKGQLKNKGKLNDYWVDITILPILDENENIVEYMAIRHDITQIVKQKEKLDNIANTDPLTGYGNRYKLIQDIKNSVRPALAILNIDNFSQVNDFYGHEKGDIVIKKLGETIAKIIEKEDSELYHLQGDEYVVLSKDVLKDNFIEKIYGLLSKIKSGKIYLDDDELHLNFSTGISFEDKENILSTGDMALKIAKRANKSLVIYSDEISLNDEYENNIKWTKKLKEALKNDNIIPVFQPIVNNMNNSWEKYECLVRMEDEEKLISPYFFLEISKKTKHYTDITKTMLNKSFEMFKDKDVEFSINLTIEDILNSEIQTYIYTMLETYQIGSKVVFEIVESESIENFNEIHEFIAGVKSYGCKIAIDDFGTGYSNFEYLVKLEADYIKIDGSLIKNIDRNKTSQLVVKNIVNFAKDLNMKTIAEFVENESILSKIKELGVDYSQGYYFSAPSKELK